MERLFFYVAFAAYAATTAFFHSYVFSRRENRVPMARVVFAAAVVFHALSLVVRMATVCQIPGHGWPVPWSDWFESFSFLALIIAVQYWLIQTREDIPVLGAFVSPFIVICLLVAVHSPAGMEISPLSLILRSPWMVVHVPLMFAAYAGFANAFIVGVVYLVQERQLKLKKPSHLAFRLPPLEQLDHLIYLIIAWSFPLLTVGLFTGAQWAHQAWGRYWGWDPKETSSFITWFVYAIYLSLRWTQGWRGRRMTYLSLAGFAVVLITCIGVNYVSPLHDFLSPPIK